MSINEQIENLKAKGLAIADKGLAEDFLNDVSYFRFIKAYSLGLKEKNGNYYAETTLDQIIELYSFDSEFRSYLFPMIERIEIMLRCRLANYFSNKYGVLSYEDSSNFSDAQHHQDFLYDISLEIDRNRRSPFVTNFRENYSDGKIPFYALVELFSFGTLSKYYKNMMNPDKKAIAATFGVGYTYFESWIENIAFVRNICAHYGRLYNAKLVKTPSLYKQYSAMPTNRIFATLICLKHLLPNDIKWASFVETIELLLQKYPHVDKKKIGFPDDWLELLITPTA